MKQFKSEIKGFFSTLGAITICIGVFAGIICAATLGNVTKAGYYSNYTERNWGLTIGIFVAVLVPSILFGALMIAISEGLSALEIISNNLGTINNNIIGLSDVVVAIKTIDDNSRNAVQTDKTDSLNETIEPSHTDNNTNKEAEEKVSESNYNPTLPPLPKADNFNSIELDIIKILKSHNNEATISEIYISIPKNISERDIGLAIDHLTELKILTYSGSCLKIDINMYSRYFVY